MSGRFAIAIGVVMTLLPSWGSGSCRADQVLSVGRSATAPLVDGLADDPAWEGIPGIVTRDHVADIPVELKAVRAGDDLYFLVRFPDPDASVTHRSWVWNPTLGEYESGGDREDVFVFKWFLTGDPSDLTLASPTPYTADIWFWKACRTDPLGYADDKIQTLSTEPAERALVLTSRTGTTMYLTRAADSGAPAYRTRVLLTNEGQVVPRFDILQPQGSRADIRAKGLWTDGWWTVEFRRRLQTGQVDDVQLDRSGSYRLGVSRYEIAGRGEEPDTSQPAYGCGDISEIITLVFTREGPDGSR